MKGDSARVDDPEHRTLAIEVWKKVVQTQEHFNEICMKVRTLYATVIAVILSVYGAFLKEGGNIVHAAGVSVNPVVPIALAILLVTYLFYFVDRFWYHQLLLGSVAQGAFIEERWAKVLPEIQMGREITAKSAVDVSSRPIIAWFLGFVVTDERLKTNKKLHSDAKIEVFYKPIGWLAFIVFLSSVFLGGIRINDRALASYGFDFARSALSADAPMGVE